MAHRAECPEIEELRGFALFKDVSAAELDRIRRRMRVCLAPRGMEIVAPDAVDGGAVYFLIMGSVHVVRATADGRLLRFAELGGNAIFGEFAAIDGRARSAGVETITPCRFAVMDRAAFVEAVTATPALSLAMLRSLTERTRQQMARVFENAVFDLRQRIAMELVRRMRVVDGVGVVRPAPRQLDLALVSGARRESVAREFGRMMRDGLFHREGADLIVTDMAALKAFVMPPNES